MRREEVEALLAACERDRIGPHPSNETLAALCRRWLAVEDAPVVCAGKSAVMDEGWQIYGTDGDSVSSLPIESGQRVRLVPDYPTPPDPGHDQARGNG